MVSIKIKPIEEKTCSKTGNIKTSEDEYCMTEHYVCVIDGATDDSSKIFNGYTLGKIISRNIKETIFILPPDAEFEEIIKLINRNIIKQYKELGIYEAILKNDFLPPTAAMALYSSYKNVVWIVNDCQCMVDDKIYVNEKTVDDITALARSLFLEAEIQKGKTVRELLEHDTSTEIVRSLINLQYYMQNTKEKIQYSYATITGFDFNLNLVKQVAVEEDAKYIVLATDGYPSLKSTLKESEHSLFHILENDPLCFREYKLAKGLKEGNISFDDRTL